VKIPNFDHKKKDFRKKKFMRYLPIKLRDADKMDARKAKRAKVFFKVSVGNFGGCLVYS